MAEHFPFTETIEKIAAGHWGQYHDTAEQAKKSLMGKVDLQGACLLTIVRQIDSIVDAMAAVSNRRTISACKIAYEAFMRQWLSEREAKHGACPRDVREWMERSLKARIGECVLYGRIPVGDDVSVYEVPCGNPKVRKSYDRWMKRKAKTTE